MSLLMVTTKIHDIAKLREAEEPFKLKTHPKLTYEGGLKIIQVEN